jgi:hypothetical protein
MAETRLTCPWCSEEKALRKSHFRAVDYIQLLFRRHPYRCMICNRRFYSHLQPRSRPDRSESAR